MGDFYNKYWDIYKDKSAYQEKIAKCVGEYFENDFPNKAAGEIRTMLSVGHGEGDIDIPLLRDHLTGVTQYHGVDVRKSASDKIQQRLGEITDRKIQATFTNSYIQQCSGPPGGQVDFIMVGHVMNYVVDEFIPVVDNLTTWLTPGGCLVLSHIDPVNFHFRTGKIVSGKGFDYERFVEERERCKEKLKIEGWTVEDHLISHSHDLSGPSSEVQLILRLILDTDLSDEQMKQVEAVIEEESEKGSKIISYNYQVSTIYKK